MEHDIDIDIDRSSPTLDEALEHASVPVTRFPPAQSYVYDEALERAKLPRGSLLATLLRKTDGLLLDGEWIRLLGVTRQACGRSLAEWNDPEGWRHAWGEGLEGRLCFADDPVGNQYAINIGREGAGNWQVMVGWVDTLEWTSLDRTFGQWLEAVLRGEWSKWYPEAHLARWRALAENDRVAPYESWVLEPPLSSGGSWETSRVLRVRASDALRRVGELSKRE